MKKNNKIEAVQKSNNVNYNNTKNQFQNKKAIVFSSNQFADILKDSQDKLDEKKLVKK